MKKNYFLAKAFAIVTFFGISSVANAQYFSDDFTSGLGQWTLEDRDGQVPNTNVAGYANAWNIAPNWDDATDSVAVSNSWYTPAGTADDWMITAQPIDLTTATAPRLAWEAKAQDASFPDGYEVYVVTTLSDITPTTTATPVFSVANEANAWTPHSVDLTSFVGSSVYVAFRNNSTDQFLLGIDDVVVEEAPSDPDVLTTASPVEYTIYPLSQAANIIGDANLACFDADVTGATVTVNVWDLSGPTNVFTATSAPASITAGNNVDFTGIGSFVPSFAGAYAVEYIASINETDSDMSNDTAVYVVQVSDSVYARDNGVVAGTLGIGAGAGQGSQLGSMFQVLNDDTLTSVQAYIANNNGALNGQPLKFNIYSMAGGVPTTLLGSSDVVTIDTTQGAIWEVQVSGGLYLGPGMYTVAVEENDSNISLGYSNAVFTLGAGFVTWAGNPNGAGVWSNNEDFNFNVTYILRAVFGTVSNPVGVAEVANPEFAIFPNPAVENLTVKNALGSTIEIYNSLGQIVFNTTANSNTFVVNVSNFDNGVYTIKSISGENTTLESFVKQ